MTQKLLGSIHKLKTAFNAIREIFKHKIVDMKIKRAAKHPPVRLVVGACGIFQPGWVPTEKRYLDIVAAERWQRYFRKGAVDAIVAEHVWEHLTPEEAKMAAKNCYVHLKNNGYIRIAVPDGYFPDAQYIEYVKPLGTGYGSDDHKVLYNYETLSHVFSSCGFTVNLLEFWDENGKFHQTPWSTDDGLIRRSKDHDLRNKNGDILYTSLIIDAIKPMTSPIEERFS